MRTISICFLCQVAIAMAGFLTSFADAQTCVNGVCQMRTPLRTAVSNIAENKPVRTVLSVARPANWRVFSQSTPSCSGAQSCSGSSSVNVAPSAAYSVPSQPIIVADSSAIVQSASSSSVVEAAGIISDRMAFRRSLKEATRNQVAQGNITPGQALLLNGLTFFPAKCDAVMAAVHDAAIDEGLATATAIDWDGLASFIERILPIILQLIQLFG